MGFSARCTLEFDDASELRLDKIMRIIEQCAYGIHDISAVGLSAGTNLPRFNMPLELGLYLGCKRFAFRSPESAALRRATRRRRGSVVGNFASLVAGERPDRRDAPDADTSPSPIHLRRRRPGTCSSTDGSNPTAGAGTRSLHRGHVRNRR
jgi:hypothetical protein